MSVFLTSPRRAALLSMDCQVGIVSIYTKDAKSAFLDKAAGVLKQARIAGMHVIHVQVGSGQACQRSIREMLCLAP